MKENNEEESGDMFSELYRLGLAIFVDDATDVPKGPFHTREEVTKGDFPVHHWLYGAIIMVSSALGKVWYALESSRQLNEAVQQV